MQGIIISYFDMLDGSRALFTYPEALSLTGDQMSHINKLLDVTFEKSFFTHQFDFSNTANYYTEVPSEWARGKYELVMVSLLIDSVENPESWKAPLEEFASHIENLPTIYKGFHYHSTKTDPEIETKLQELKALTKSFYESIPETITVQRIVKLFMFGLDRAGKTSISKRVSENLYENTSPTLWLDVHNFKFQNFQFVCFDLGGQKQFRSFWKNYLHNSEILIFVLDGTQVQRLPEARSELWNMLEDNANNLPLLVLNNKADLEGHPDNAFIASALSLNNLSCPWHVLTTSAKSGLGINDALKWISNHVMN